MVITRLNVGGPTNQAVILTEALNAGEFRACLLCGSVGPGEGDVTPEAVAKGLPVTQIPAMRLSAYQASVRVSVAQPCLTRG